MRRRGPAVLGSLVFLVIAPGFVAGLVPFWISRWRMLPPLLGVTGSRLAGALLVAAGLPVLLESFWRFPTKGLGTPAPILPTERLVVTGFYRYVRNPMYVAVVAIITGQGLLFGNVRVLEYAGLVWCFFHLFMVLYEEPSLAAAFPAEYETFRANVPRWMPRLRPWEGQTVPAGDDVLETLQRIAGESGPRADRARRIAEILRASGGHRWVGL